MSLRRFPAWKPLLGFAILAVAALSAAYRGEKTLTIQVLCGTVGDETEICPDCPSYEVGEKRVCAARRRRSWRRSSFRRRAARRSK